VALRKFSHFHDGGFGDRRRGNTTASRYSTLFASYLLLLDADGDDSQIHSHHAIDNGNEENQSRTFAPSNFPKRKITPRLVFAQDADRLRKND